MKTSDLGADEYHKYYQPYIDVLGDTDLLAMLNKQVGNFPEFIKSIPEEKLHFSYGNGKWTVAEVLMHILDAERVFQYRALCFGRNDKTSLPSFDQDSYVPESASYKRTKKDIIEEYKAVRKSTIALFSSFDNSILKRRGTASNAEMSVGALGFVICGHQKHHRNIIRERYL